MTLYMETLYERLASRHFISENQTALREQLSLNEHHATYVLLLKTKKECCSFQVDGYLIPDNDTEKCDKVVLVKAASNRWGEIFVELKGTKIAHAIQQIKATLSNPLFKGTICSFKKARVVMGNRIPANTGNSIIERAKVDFRKSGCEFRTLKSNQPDIIRDTDFN